eukprot:jgi/Tetstr1/435370/TSEL_024288.t1
MSDASPASLDRRLHPVRPDLAAESYRGRVEADAFAPGVAMQVAADSVALRPVPDLARSIDTEALHGEIVTVYETRGDGWAWGSWRPTATYRYPDAELRSPPLGLLSMGARVRVIGHATTRGLEFALLDDGSAMVARHLVPLNHREADWVGVAETFLGTPYLWGGRTSLGLDCSAIVQLAAAAAGLALPRDTDMQERAAGEPLDIAAGLPALMRGDLVFWKGHVGIMRDGETLLHANGHSMSVASEPLAPAVARIARNEWGAVTSVRRIAW